MNKLAVGDAEFQMEKRPEWSFRREAIGMEERPEWMVRRDLKDVSKGVEEHPVDGPNRHRTVLFVSHNMASIRALCHHGILLENGGVKAMGTANEICDLYLEDNSKGLGDVWERPINESKDFQVYRVELLDEKGEGKTSFTVDENVCIRMHCRKKQNIPGLYGYLLLSKADGTAAWESDSNDIQMNKLERLPIGDSTMDIIIPKRTLGHGRYSVYLNFTSSQNFSGFNVDSPMDVCVFDLSDERTNRGNNRGGHFSTVLDWSF